MITKHLRVLIVEDMEDDALLLVRSLNNKGFSIEYERVDNSSALRSALQNAPTAWDIILTDHNMPGFGSAEALSIIQELVPETPVIIVSGDIGEEHAVNAMRNGARDYVMKDNLARLYPAIERELASAKVLRSRRAIEKSIQHMSYHDALTGLVNRQGFINHLERVLHNLMSDETEHAVCYLDLDQFKVINDTCGYRAGDQLIRHISKLLSDRIRSRDTLARFGGDDFAVLLKYCGSEELQALTKDLQQAVQDFQFEWEDKLFHLSVSIGVVTFRSNRETASSLISAADSACYQAKEEGRNRVHLVDQNDITSTTRISDMNWVSRIHHALEEGQFELTKQPIISLADDQASGGEHFEISVRLKQDNQAAILSDAFLPAAERYNLSEQIDRWVIASTFDWLSGPRVDLKSIFLCSINISAQSLCADGVIESIIELLENKRIPADKICFEITETAAITNLERAVRFIETLKKIGCRFTLDDFGSGFCSFAYLKNLPVDYLKIDGVFIRNIVENPIDLAMVKAINDIGHLLGIKTIALNTETDSIVNLLRETGIEYAQGDAVGRSEPIAIQ